MNIVTHGRPDDGALVVASGEIDVSCADELRAEIEAALDEGARSLEVDLSQVAYIDSTGIGVLVGAARKCADADIAFALLDPQRNVARVLKMLELDEELGVRETGE